jgi:two-component system nitrogen regulation response regulator GlnG
MLPAAAHLPHPESLPAPPRARPRAGAPRAGDGSLDRLVDDLLARGEKDVYARVTEHVERALFSRVLSQTHGHQAQASDILGINRTTLRHKLRALGLAVDKVVTEEE